MQLEEECAQNQKDLLLSGRQITFIMYSHLKINDTQSKVTSLNELIAQSRIEKATTGELWTL